MLTLSQLQGLKTLPSSTANIKVTEVLYPDLFLEKERAPGVLRALAKERQGLHMQRMWYSLIGLPFVCHPVVRLQIC